MIGVAFRRFRRVICVNAKSADEARHSYLGKRFKGVFMRITVSKFHTGVVSLLTGLALCACGLETATTAAVVADKKVQEAEQANQQLDQVQARLQEAAEKAATRQRAPAD